MGPANNLHETEKQIHDFEKEISSMRAACALHKLEISSKFDIVEQAFEENGIIQNMNRKLNEIDHRLFRTNGNRALVDEVKDIKSTMTQHIQEHSNRKINTAKLIFIIIGIVATNTLGIFMSNFTYKILNPPYITQNQIP